QRVGGLRVGDAQPGDVQGGQQVRRPGAVFAVLAEQHAPHSAGGAAVGQRHRERGKFFAGHGVGVLHRDQRVVQQSPRVGWAVQAGHGFHQVGGAEAGDFDGVQGAAVVGFGEVRGQQSGYDVPQQVHQFGGDEVEGAGSGRGDGAAGGGRQPAAGAQLGVHLAAEFFVGVGQREAGQRDGGGALFRGEFADQVRVALGGCGQHRVGGGGLDRAPAVGFHGDGGHQTGREGQAFFGGGGCVQHV